MANRPRLSIVLPCYNEGLNLPFILERFAAVKTGHSVEMILVNNGSTDNSSAILGDIFSNNPPEDVQVVEVTRNIGYGHGIMSGIRQARGEYLAWTHADLQTDLGDVITGLEKLENTTTPVTTLLRGRRYGRPFTDTFFTWGMGVFATITLGARLFDVNAQPKMFHHSLLKHMDNAPDDFSLDLFILFLAHKQKWKTIELPVHFGERKHGEAKGGGTFKGKIKLVKRTYRYILELRRSIKAGLR